MKSGWEDVGTADNVQRHAFATTEILFQLSHGHVWRLIPRLVFLGSRDVIHSKVQGIVLVFSVLLPELPHMAAVKVYEDADGSNNR